MKEPKWETANEEEVWKFVAWHLAKNGIATILGGGAGPVMLSFVMEITGKPVFVNQ